MNNELQFSTKLTWQEISKDDYENSGVYIAQEREIINAWIRQGSPFPITLYSLGKIKVTPDEMNKAMKYVEDNQLVDGKLATVCYGVNELKNKKIFFSVIESLEHKNRYLVEIDFITKDKNYCFNLMLETEIKPYNFQSIKDIPVVADVLEIIENN